ncbi:MAG TPA: response regulator transcription factor [Salinivirgaceae bacterium]|nr:response regulator transcription factor [Salinivirgaceae bacterium]
MKIAIADDHFLIRLGIESILQKRSDFQIVGLVSSGNELIEILKKEYIDLVILDIDMPEPDGVETAKWIKEHSPHTRIFFITSHTNKFTFLKAQRLSPAGFLLKENSQDELELALTKISKGETYYCKASKKLFEEYKSTLEHLKSIEKKLDLLSEKEKQVLKHVTEGKTTKEIAELTFNSYKTIENHRTNICKKLNLQGNNNLLMFAFENKEILLQLL